MLGDPKPEPVYVGLVSSNFNFMLGDPKPEPLCVGLVSLNCNFMMGVLKPVYVIIPTSTRMTIMSINELFTGFNS